MTDKMKREIREILENGMGAAKKSLIPVIIEMVEAAYDRGYRDGQEANHE